MRPYAIGLDIGIASVGWAALALDDKETPCGILYMGSRIFDAAENPKDGSSLAAPRREKRALRRITRRRSLRKQRIRSLLISSGIITKQQLDSLFDGQLEDIYALRVRALDGPVTAEEFARILIHLSQRRGFRSNRKTAAEDPEEGALLTATSENKARMRENGYRTPAEMYLNDPRFAESRRNKGGEYIGTVTRDMTEDEIRSIFAAQREYGSKFAGEELENRYLEILLSQRSFDEGPGGNSPYGGGQIGKMAGKCTFYPEEQRAAKAAWSFEYCTLLQKINHIRILNGGASRPLTDDERRTVIELARASDGLTYGKIRKKLSLTASDTFSEVRYNADKFTDPEKMLADAEKEKFDYLKAYHKIRKAIDKNEKGRFAGMSMQQLNAIGTVLTLYKTEKNIRQHLEDAGLEPQDIDAVLSLSFSKFGHLSIKACNEIIPYLEQGMNYDSACTAAGLDFRAHGKKDKTATLHPKPDDFADITSPVARRAISQTIKVINAIVRKMGGSPVYVNIELAREMAKTRQERNELDKKNQENRARNERLMERIRTEYNHPAPTGLDLVKLKLFEEQDGKCMYSGKSLSIERLFEAGYAEVDHIVPYSISFDDSYKNKVLVLTAENRNKGNRLPLQYLTGQQRDDFCVRVNNYVRDRRKRALLLKETITEEDEKKWKERSLTDTKTMSRFLYNYIRDNLLMAPSVTGKVQRVTAVNGSVTAYLRSRWGIRKVREDGDLHHAVDAVVIACTSPGLIQRVTRYSQYKECRYIRDDDGALPIAVNPDTGEVLTQFPQPWEKFRRELEARLAEDPSREIANLRLPFYMEEDAPEVHKLFVSRMPRRKVHGEAHKETIRSRILAGEGYTVSKTALTSLKLDKFGEIDGYYNPGSDTLLYNALKERLKLFGGKGEKAFAEPFYKPRSDGSRGPRVKKVKVMNKSTLNVPAQQGTAVADNGDMVRVDVYHVEGDGYYLVPIYVPDTLKPELPYHACISKKGYSQWKPMREEDFIFSLFPNDLIYIQGKNGLSLDINQKDSTLPATMETDADFFYFRRLDIATARIAIINHDNTYGTRIGVKTLPKIEKYTVDVLGEISLVQHEKRQTFASMKRRRLFGHKDED